MPDRLRILEGSTFCICDELGDLGRDVEGLYTEDTRFLSMLKLIVNGKRSLLLSSDRIEYFSAAFFMRNPLSEGLPQDALSIRRERFVGDGMQDAIAVVNESMEPVEFDLGIELGSDFADIFAVKDHDFALGDPLRAPPLPDLRHGEFDGERNQFLVSDVGELSLKTQLIFSKPGEAADSSMRYRLSLEPRERWDLQIDVFPLPDGEQVTPRFAERRFGEEVGRVRDSLSAWQLRVPQLRASWDVLGHAFDRSVADLASLRMRSDNSRIGKLPGAGVPWFMSVFGRDTIITCLQTLLFGPELARTALEVLAEMQAHEDNASIDAEPGKIVHEVRHGKAALRWHERYYGTVDATPLYLILLSEVWRWTDDAALVGEKRRVDALCSNIGHLLWSGIVPPHRVDAIVDRLMGDDLWSGWGVRTMSTADAAYNPLAYHNGTVWPHDNSLIAAGLGRYARWPEAQRIVQRMLTAASHFEFQLPEVFAGMRRSETPFPIAYPTAARPQAWAAGTPVLLLQVLLGLQPDRRRHALETLAPIELPSWAGSIRLSGVRAFDRVWDVRLSEGRVKVDEA